MSAATAGQVTRASGDGGSIPTSPLQLRLEQVRLSVAQDFCRRHHYRGNVVPVQHTLSFGVYAGEWWAPRLVGALIFCRPAARLEDQETTLELSRMALLDECPRNSESRCLGVAARLVRRLRPHIRRLIAYADSAQGHRGTIYAAAGWRCAGETAGDTWHGRRGRPGRAVVAPSPKTKWEKTP